MTTMTHINLVKRAIIKKVSNKVPYYSGEASISVRRIKANEFKLKNRFETATENCTMFTQFMNSGYRKPEKWAVNHKRPFHVSFINENSEDAGGPMRDAIGNLCVEIMSGVLPLLRPTSNNLARIEPGMDCY